MLSRDVGARETILKKVNKVPDIRELPLSWGTENKYSKSHKCFHTSRE